jgi:hypothetical protein
MMCHSFARLCFGFAGLILLAATGNARADMIELTYSVSGTFPSEDAGKGTKTIPTMSGQITVTDDSATGALVSVSGSITTANFNSAHSEYDATFTSFSVDENPAGGLNYTEIIGSDDGVTLKLFVDDGVAAPTKKSASTFFPALTASAYSLVSKDDRVMGVPSSSISAPKDDPDLATGALTTPEPGRLVSLAGMGLLGLLACFRRRRS